MKKLLACTSIMSILLTLPAFADIDFSKLDQAVEMEIQQDLESIASLEQKIKETQKILDDAEKEIWKNDIAGASKISIGLSGAVVSGFFLLGFTDNLRDFSKLIGFGAEARYRSGAALGTKIATSALVGGVYLIKVGISDIIEYRGKLNELEAKIDVLKEVLAEETKE